MKSEIILLTTFALVVVFCKYESIIKDIRRQKTIYRLLSHTTLFMAVIS